MKRNKPWIAIASVSLSIAALSASPLGHAAGDMILPRGSVGTQQLKAGAVTAAKVQNGSLTAAKFKPGQLPQGPKGESGLPGPKGDKGDKGDAGAPGLSGYVIALGQVTTLAPGQPGNSLATCPAGKKAIGGGAAGQNGIALQYSGPTPNGASWSIVGRNTGPLDSNIAAMAVCATVGS